MNVFECILQGILPKSWRVRPSRVFFFEGNVGVGKSECMKIVAEILREKGIAVICIEEDVERWSTEGLLAAKYGGDVSLFMENR